MKAVVENIKKMLEKHQRPVERAMQLHDLLQQWEQEDSDDVSADVEAKKVTDFNKSPFPLEATDRSKWKKGTWCYEPDGPIYWRDYGSNCVICRGPYGHWCGYVELMPEHCLYGKDWWDEDCAIKSIQVHGGINYSQDLDGQWFIGFSADQSYDLKPQTAFPGESREGRYRDVGFMIRETRSVAKQIQEINCVYNHYQ